MAREDLSTSTVGGAAAFEQGRADDDRPYFNRPAPQKYYTARERYYGYDIEEEMKDEPESINKYYVNQ